MCKRVFKFSSFFLTLFLIISCSHLFASDEQIELVKPLIEAEAEIKDGILYVVIKAPSHLTIIDNYKITAVDDSKGVESMFLFTEQMSDNLKLINFSVSAKNTNDGIDCSIDEIQIFEELGWFINRRIRKEASQIIHIQDSILDIEAVPEIRTATKVFPSSAVVHFRLLDK
jgi:hypothetical protein